MNLLDENIIESQRQELRERHISTRQIGVDVGWKGMTDGDVIRLLHDSNQTTFFTRDGDFHTRRLCHESYCLVFLDVDEDEVAELVRRTLRHGDAFCSGYEQPRKQKPRTGRMDLRIAAIALAHDAKLVTRNVADFQNIEGLSVVDWSRE